MEKRRKLYRGRVATVVALTSALLLVSTCLYVLFSSRAQLQSVVGEAHLSVMVRDNSSIDPAIGTDSITLIAGVRSAQYIDSTAAQKEFSTYLGVDLTSVLGEGAIPASYIVGVDMSGGSRAIEQIKSKIAAMDFVESVSYDEVIVGRTTKLTDGVNQFAICFTVVIGLLAAIIFYIIASYTVGLTSNSMTNAPDRYIRRLLVRRSVVDGATSGVIAAVVLLAAAYCLDMLYPTLGLPFDTLPLIASSVLVGGFLANLIFTYILTLQISSK